MAQYGPQIGKKMFSEARRVYDREVSHTIQSVRHAIAGAALTHVEKPEWDAMLANDSGWQSGSNAKAIEQFEARFRDAYVAAADSLPGLEAIPKGERRVRRSADGDDVTSAGYATSLHGDEPMGTPVDAAVTSVVAVGKGGRNAVRRSGFSPFYAEYSATTKDSRGAGSTGGRDSEPGQRAEIDGVDQLMALIARPELGLDGGTVDGTPTRTPEDLKRVQAAAYSAVQGIAAGTEVRGAKPDPEAQVYAKAALAGFFRFDSAEEAYRAFASRVHVDQDDSIAQGGEGRLGPLLRGVRAQKQDAPAPPGAPLGFNPQFDAFGEDD
jgi:hypothetical protein